jgi:hypothetical protein
VPLGYLGELADWPARSPIPARTAAIPLTRSTWCSRASPGFGLSGPTMRRGWELLRVVAAFAG